MPASQVPLHLRVPLLSVTIASLDTTKILKPKVHVHHVHQEPITPTLDPSPFPTVPHVPRELTLKAQPKTVQAHASSVKQDTIPSTLEALPSQCAWPVQQAHPAWQIGPHARHAVLDTIPPVQAQPHAQQQVQGTRAMPSLELSGAQHVQQEIQLASMLLHTRSPWDLLDKPSVLLEATAQAPQTLVPSVMLVPIPPPLEPLLQLPARLVHLLRTLQLQEAHLAQPAELDTMAHLLDKPALVLHVPSVRQAPTQEPTFLPPVQLAELDTMAHFQGRQPLALHVPFAKRVPILEQTSLPAVQLADLDTMVHCQVRPLLQVVQFARLEHIQEPTLLPVAHLVVKDTMVPRQVKQVFPAVLPARLAHTLEPV